MKNPFNELKDSLLEMESDFQKFFDKGNKAAGTRVRKGLMDLRNRMQEIRKEVQEAKNSAA
ncbi:MAG: histone H1 [Bacteroidetes bacterium]|nr:histone H1 [Bacteroidota bacterium]